MNDNTVSLVLEDRDVDYARLLEMRPDELDFMRNECSVCIEELKGQLIAEYRIIRPALDRMKNCRLQLRRLRDRHEMVSMFMSLDRASFQLVDWNAKKQQPTTPRTIHSVERILKDMLAADGVDRRDDSPPPPPPPPTAQPSPRSTATVRITTPKRRGRSRTPRR